MSWINVTHEGRTLRLAVARDQRGVWIGWPGGSALFEKESRLNAGNAHNDDVRAPMTGKVVKLNVKSGDTVYAGDILVILEAMKMEYRLSAPHAGKVEQVHCRDGDLVELGKVLIKLIE